MAADPFPILLHLCQALPSSLTSWLPAGRGIAPRRLHYQRDETVLKNALAWQQKKKNRLPAPPIPIMTLCCTVTV